MHSNRPRQKLLMLCVMMILPLTKADADLKLNDDFAAWGAIQGQGSIPSEDAGIRKWQWWMEGQARFFNGAERLGQTLVRPGFGYKVFDKLSVWLGYAWINTRPRGGSKTNENRIWQQLSWNKAYAWGNLATRTRLEQRFLNNGDDTGWRFRQFVKYTHPLFSQRLYASVWDEVFVNINSTDWGADNGFAQNRAFAGLGLYVDEQRHYRVELGYLNQYLNVPGTNDGMNHIISASLFIRY